MEVEYTLNILLTRIGNRLVCGQVGVIRARTLGTNLIAVAGDTAAEDRIQQSLMGVITKSSGVGIRFFTIEKTAVTIGRAAPEQKISIVYRTPKDVRRLMGVGVALKEISVGDMRFSEGRRTMTRKVHVDDEGIDNLKYLVSKGTNVHTQGIPGDPKPATE